MQGLSRLHREKSFAVGVGKINDAHGNSADALGIIADDVGKHITGQ